jgi:hypothetical protein
VSGFSKDFNMLESGEEHPAIGALHGSMLAIAIIGQPMPWLLALMSSVPALAGGYAKFSNWCTTELEDKKQVIAEEKARGEDAQPADVMSWLIRAEDQGDRSAPPGKGAMEEDSRLLIITGRYGPILESLPGTVNTDGN